MDARVGSSARSPGTERVPGFLRPFWVLLALLSILGAAVGCSSGQVASPVLSPLGTTAVNTPTATATPPPPTVSPEVPSTSTGAPPPVTPLTREGAETFARYWFGEFDRAYDHLDPAIIAAITTPDCVSCQAYLRDLRQIKAAGQSYRGGKSVLRYVVAAPLEGESVSVLVTYEAKELLVIDALGVVVQRIPAEPKVVVDIDLSWRQSSWVIKEVTRT